MLLHFETETTEVAGAVFVTLSIVAALAFTYAGVLPSDSEDRSKVIYAGERMFQGTMRGVALRGRAVEPDRSGLDGGRWVQRRTMT